MKITSFSLAALASAARPRGQASEKTDGALAAPLSKKDEMAARKLQEAKNAVATLAGVKSKGSDDQKARAAEKVKQLKARLQSLKMIYAGDPKKLARAAAQIARELGAAVKSYVDAGGGAGELGGVDAGAAPAETADAAGEGGAEGSEAGAASAENAAAPATEAAEGDKADDKSAPGLGKPDDGKSAADSAREKADADFAREARALARELKAALRRGHAKGPDEEDRRSGEEALASVDKALGALPIADIGVAAVMGI